jgi:uncharacterized protein (TIGR00369 family)
MTIDVGAFPKIPSRELLGGTVLSASIEDARAAIRYMPPNSMVNPNGSIQGGFVAAMLDDVIGLLTYITCGMRPFATSQMSLNFLRPSPPGVALIAEASRVYLARRHVVMDGQLRIDGDAKILSRVTQIQMFLDTGSNP